MLEFLPLLVIKWDRMIFVITFHDLLFTTIEKWMRGVTGISLTISLLIRILQNYFKNWSWNCHGTAKGFWIQDVFARIQVVFYHAIYKILVPQGPLKIHDCYTGLHVPKAHTSLGTSCHNAYRKPGLLWTDFDFKWSAHQQFTAVNMVNLLSV